MWTTAVAVVFPERTRPRLRRLITAPPDKRLCELYHKNNCTIKKLVKFEEELGSAGYQINDLLTVIAAPRCGPFTGHTSHPLAAIPQCAPMSHRVHLQEQPPFNVCKRRWRCSITWENVKVCTALLLFRDYMDYITKIVSRMEACSFAGLVYFMITLLLLKN